MGKGKKWRNIKIAFRVLFFILSVGIVTYSVFPWQLSQKEWELYWKSYRVTLGLTLGGGLLGITLGTFLASISADLSSLFDAMVIGTKELIFASNQAGMEEEKMNDKEVRGTVLVSILLGVGIFMLLPSYIGGLVFREDRLAANIVESIVKLVFFLGYIWGISFLKDIKRVFEYHGAEHKSIMNYEMGKELTPQNAKECTRFHPRCGTSFLLIVMFISILVFSTLDLIFGVPENTFAMLIYKLFTRVLFVPLVAGISYELQRWTSYHLSNPVARMISAPGIWLQKITTSEPDESQLEVAIVALNVALGKEVENAVEVSE